MRLVIAALILSAAPQVYCQSSEVQQENSCGVPPAFTLPAPEFGKMPQQQWRMSNLFPAADLFRTEPKTLKPLGDAQIDPAIIIRPSQSKSIDQPQGTMIAQNQFPGLQFLPIDLAQRAKIKPIPTTWPLFKLEPIPTGCPQCAMLPVADITQKSSTRPAK